MAELLSTSINGYLKVYKNSITNNLNFEVEDDLKGNTIVYNTLKVDNITNKTDNSSLTIKAPTVIENDNFTVKPINGDIGTEYFKIFKNGSTMQVNIKPSTIINGTLSANSGKLSASGEITTIRSTNFSITDTTLANGKYPIFFNITKNNDDTKSVTIGPNTTIGGTLSANGEKFVSNSTNTSIKGAVKILNNTNKTDGNLNVGNNAEITGTLKANEENFYANGDTTTIKSNNFYIKDVSSNNCFNIITTKDSTATTINNKLIASNNSDLYGAVEIKNITNGANGSLTIGNKFKVDTNNEAYGNFYVKENTDATNNYLSVDKTNFNVNIPTTITNNLNINNDTNKSIFEVNNTNNSAQLDLRDNENGSFSIVSTNSNDEESSLFKVGINSNTKKKETIIGTATTHIKGNAIIDSGATIYGALYINNKGEGNTFEPGNLEVSNNTIINGTLSANDEKLNASGATTTIRSTNFSITDTDPKAGTTNDYPVFFSITKDKTNNRTNVTIKPNTTIEEKLITNSAEIKKSLWSNKKTTLKEDVFINNDIEFRDTINLIKNSKFISTFDNNFEIISGFDNGTVYFSKTVQGDEIPPNYIVKYIIDKDGNLINDDFIVSKVKMPASETAIIIEYRYFLYKSDNSNLNNNFVGGVALTSDKFMYINNDKIISPEEFANISFGSGFNIYPAYATGVNNETTTLNAKINSVEFAINKTINTSTNQVKYETTNDLTTILNQINNNFKKLDLFTNETLDFKGTIKANVFSAKSDIRLKNNIEIYKAKKSILDVPVRTFTFKNDEKQKTQIGIMAQDLKEVEPLLVDTDPDGYYSIRESKLVYLLLEQLQNDHKKIEELTNRIEQLEKGAK